jgi:type VI secretion system Hcp family effector
LTYGAPGEAAGNFPIPLDGNVRSVTCTLYRNAGDGVTRAYYKIALTNATIVEIKDSGDGANGAAHGHEHEHVSFVYQRIELTDLDSNTVALDDWTSFQ